MNKRIFKDLQPQSLGPHPDYSKNLSMARLYCQKIQKNLLNGLSAKICDSEGIKEALLMVSFTPPSHSKTATFAAPIFLHQSSSEVSRQIEEIFNTYRTTAEKFWERRRKEEQPHFF